MRSSAIAMAFLASASATAHANDSTAELGAGGLILSRSDAIVMAKEDLFISEEQVRVDYVFRNTTEEDVETLVAFPMPDIEASPYGNVSIPDDTSDNFLGFQVKVDGQPVQPRLEQRAIAVGIDVTDDLRSNGVALFPYGDEAQQALSALAEDVVADWRDRGIIVIDEYDDGSGWKRVPSAFWTLRSTYWWPMVFPAGTEIRVSHSYTPSVGATVGLSFFYDGKFQGDAYQDHKSRYCMDEGFEAAILKSSRGAPDGFPPLFETWISYILKTGGNWGGGTIGDFTLTIDKGDPKNLVSFCGSGVKKIGPTTFQMKATDFYPEKNLDVLILKRMDAN